VTTHNKWQKGT